MVCLHRQLTATFIILSTVQMSNDKGTWFGWEVEKMEPVKDKAIYDMAKSFALSVGKGSSAG